MKHVIIGVGAAGISAAETIRKNRPSDEIVMLSKDAAVHSRCMLHKFIGGKRNVEALSFIPSDFFEKNKITWKPSTTVTKIDIKNKIIYYNDTNETYDKLLIATGAKSAFPPIKGLKASDSVYGLRDLYDAKAIREKAQTAKNIVIIGAGLVGLDAAYGLLEMGKKPVVVDMANCVLSANLDPRAAKTYQTKFEEVGCTFRFGAKVSSVQSDVNESVMSVTLNENEEIPCDLLIVAAGVKPENSLLPSTEINKFLSVGDENVFVAGDASAFSESWPSAVEQGQVAGLNMCNIKTVYDKNYPQKNTVNFFGVASLSVGKFIETDGDTIDVREDKEGYKKVVLNGGVPVGIILQGDISRSGFWQSLIKNKINITEIPKSPWKISFADAYGLKENGEYEWNN